MQRAKNKTNKKTGKNNNKLQSKAADFNCLFNAETMFLKYF